MILSLYVQSSFPCFSLYLYICLVWDKLIEKHVQRSKVKRLHSLLTIKESAANVPKNLEARRRLKFFTNSLFMEMPAAKPVTEMLSFRYYVFHIYAIRNCNCPCWFLHSSSFIFFGSVFTPYYSETVLYSMSELLKKNEDGISILFYLQKIYPGKIIQQIADSVVYLFTCWVSS